MPYKLVVAKRAYAQTLDSQRCPKTLNVIATVTVLRPRSHFIGRRAINIILYYTNGCYAPKTVVPNRPSKKTVGDFKYLLVDTNTRVRANPRLNKSGTSSWHLPCLKVACLGAHCSSHHRIHRRPGANRQPLTFPEPKAARASLPESQSECLLPGLTTHFGHPQGVFFLGVALKPLQKGNLRKTSHTHMQPHVLRSAHKTCKTGAKRRCVRKHILSHRHPTRSKP